MRRSMIPVTLIMLLADTPLADPPTSMTEEAINWDDYAPCGLVSLYLICQLHENSVSWEKVKELVGTPRPGGQLSFADLATAATQLGMHPVGLEVGREALDVLPMPAIIQVHDARYPEEIPHFLVLLRPEADGAWLLDAPYAAYFLPEDRFRQSWTGKMLVFARDEQEAQQINGLGYGRLDLQWVVRGLVVSAVSLLLILGLIDLLLRNKSRNIPLVEWANGLLYRRLATSFCQTKRFSITVTLLFVTAALSLLLLYTFVIRRYNDMPPRCEFNEQAMLLGELTPGEHSIRVPIKNAGDHSLIIRQVISNCSCCAVVRSPSLIEPRQSTMLDVQLTVIPGPRSIQLSVQSNDPDGEKHVVLSWQGKAKPMLVPRWVSVPSAPLDRPYERTIRLVYAGGKSAVVPHLKSWECEHRGVEVLEGRNDPLATKFSTLGILTSILGEMELHLRIHPPSKPAYVQAICKLSLSYGKGIQTINLPLLLSFSGGQLVPDVSSVTFSATRRENLLSQERLVSIADRDPVGEISISDAPRWLTCEIHRKSDGHHLLRLKVVSVPSVLPAQHDLHFTRRGGASPQATLRIQVLGGSTL